MWKLVRESWQQREIKFWVIYEEKAKNSVNLLLQRNMDIFLILRYISLLVHSWLLKLCCEERLTLRYKPEDVMQAESHLGL